MLKILRERGLIQSCNDYEGLQTLTSESCVCAYLGIDCTAVSLHIGHLIPLMVALHLLKAGHKVILLLGGATTRIGDPSGKDKTRPTLSEREINNNIERIKDFLTGWFSLNGCSNNISFVNNLEWFAGVKYMDFLREYGRHFSVNEMLTLTSVKDRLARHASMNFVEFNYVLMQSYDFCELHKRYGCVLQIGGSDQWGNIAHGISLGKRLDMSLYGIVTPLLATADGRKMGKTEGKAVWLSQDLLSSYDYWQFFRNVDDINLEKWWNYFTFMPYDVNQDTNEIKVQLATLATTICRGEEEAQKAELRAKVIFTKNTESIETENWSATELSKLLEMNDAEWLGAVKPVFHADPVLNDGITYRLNNNQKTLPSIIYDAGLSSSMGEAKNLMRGHAIKLNGIVVDDVQLIPEEKDFRPGNRATLSVGKKRHVVILGDFVGNKNYIPVSFNLGYPENKNKAYTARLLVEKGAAKEAVQVLCKIALDMARETGGILHVTSIDFIDREVEMCIQISS